MLVWYLKKLLCYKAPLREGGTFWHVSMGRWVFYTQNDLGLWGNCFSRTTCTGYPKTQATLTVVSSCIACNVAGQCRVQHRLLVNTGVVNGIGSDILLIRFQSYCCRKRNKAARASLYCAYELFADVTVSYFIQVILGRLYAPPQKLELYFCKQGLGSRVWTCTLWWAVGKICVRKSLNAQDPESTSTSR